MNKNNKFSIEIINLSDSDLEKIYQMACQRLKDEKASGKDISGTEQKLAIISAEMIRRRRLEKNPEKVINSERINLEIREKNKEKAINLVKKELQIKEPEAYRIIEKKHSSNGDEER